MQKDRGTARTARGKDGKPCNNWAKDGAADLQRSGRAVAARSTVVLMWNSRRRAAASPAYVMRVTTLLIERWSLFMNLSLRFVWGAVTSRYVAHR